MRGSWLALLLLLGARAANAAEADAWYSIESPTSENLTSVQFAPDGTGFVAGANGTVLRRRTTDSKWQVLPFSLPAVPLGSLAALSSEEAWIVPGNGGHILHFQANVWTDELLDRDFSISSIDFAGPSLGYCVGLFGIMFRYDGTRWQRVTDPAWSTDRESHLQGVAVFAEDDVWVGGTQFLLHFNGKRWERLPLPDGATEGILRRVGNEVVIISGPVMIHHGSSWETIPSPRAESVGRSPTNAWWGVVLAGRPRYLLRLSPPGDELVLDWQVVGIGSGPDGLWAVGERGTILHLEPRVLPSFVDMTFDAGAGVQARSRVAMLVDLDGSEPRDLLLGVPFGRHSFLQADGDGAFRSHPLVSPRITDVPEATAFDAADLDGDGRVDLVLRVPERSGKRSIYEMRNLGGFRFWDANTNTDLGVDGDVATGNFLIADLDSDQDLDIYEARFIKDAGGFQVPNVVYRNDGFGHLDRQELSEHDGGASLRWSRRALAADFTNDGRIDLAGLNSWGDGNSFYIQNAAGRFDDATIGSGIQGADQDSHDGAIGDIDGNGTLDVLVLATAQFGPSRLYRNDGQGHFHDVTTESGIDVVFASASRAEFSDLDLDGDLDLVVAGALPRDAIDIRAGKLRFLVNDGRGHFADVTKKASLDQPAQNVVVDDFDDDGDQDLYVIRPGDANRLLANEPPSHGFLKVQLVSPPPNRVALGSRISVFGQDGRLLGVRETDTRHPDGHFGLGDETAVDVEVRFPSGKLIREKNVSANTRLTLAEVTRLQRWAQESVFFVAHRWSWAEPKRMAISLAFVLAWLLGLPRIARLVGARSLVHRVPVLGGLWATYAILEVGYLPLVPVSAAARIVPCASVLLLGFVLLVVDRAWTRRQEARFVGPYQLMAEVGRGGMGVVYRARDKSQPQRPIVALKVLRPERVGDPATLRRFLREADIGARLQHPGIVSVLASGECRILDGRTWRSTAYLAMEYIEGASLTTLLASGDRLPLARAVDIVRDAALALAAAHEMGVLHRDIKPDNLLISRAGVVKIVDFGIASLARAPSFTEAGLLVGTLAYLPPERAAGRPEDARGDLYALGVVLYEAICGQRPFRGAAEDTASLLRAILDEPIVPPIELVPDLPARLNDLVVSLLAKDPGQRPASARTVADELEQVMPEIRGERVKETAPPGPMPVELPPFVREGKTVPKADADRSARVTADFPMPMPTSESSGAEEAPMATRGVKADRVTADFPLPSSSFPSAPAGEVRDT